MEKTGDAFFDAIAPLCDTIIWTEEVDLEKKYAQDIFDAAISHRDAFLDQVRKKLSKCKSELEKGQVMETTVNFLLFSTKSLIVDLDDEQIEEIADHFHKQILSVKRVK